MDTKWDDDRIRITIKDRGNKDPITGLDQVGYVVQLHDHGSPGERLARAVLMFDSEAAHGTAGLFGDPTEAQEYADRRLAAERACQRAIESERHARKEALSERQRGLWAEEKRQKEIASEANKAAKAADKQARVLADEAEAPDIAVSCNPSDDGWSLWVGPCHTDGTQGGDPRQLTIVGSGLLGPRKLADDRTPPKPRGMYPQLDQGAAEEIMADAARRKGKKKPPPRPGKAPEAPPKHVGDGAGLPIGLGSRVQFSVQDGDGWTDLEGKITRIGDLDPCGAHMVEIEADDGHPYQALATECTRVPAEDEDSEDWPDPEAA